jgi:hypothetical protein
MANGEQRRYTVEQIEHALEQTKGNISAAARALGANRTTIYKRIADSPTLQRVLEDAREEMIDVAETALYNEVLQGNIAAIIFTLKTQGKGRGYVERTQQEVSGPDGAPIEGRIHVDLSNLTTQQLKALAAWSDTEEGRAD